MYGTMSVVVLYRTCTVVLPPGGAVAEGPPRSVAASVLTFLSFYRSPPSLSPSYAMTSCKEAIKDIEVDGVVAAEAEEVRLCPIAMMKPLITKMDNSLSTLKKCKHLRMSSNAIAKIEGLAGCDSLQIISLGRNNLKKIEGLNDLSDTLEQIWISYNQIASLAGIEKLVNLQVLLMSNNKIDKWPEVERLQALPKLRDLNLVNNPIWTKTEGEGLSWRIELLKVW